MLQMRCICIVAATSDEQSGVPMQAKSAMLGNTMNSPVLKHWNSTMNWHITMAQLTHITTMTLFLKVNHSF